MYISLDRGGYFCLNKPHRILYELLQIRYHWMSFSAISAVLRRFEHLIAARTYTCKHALKLPRELVPPLHLAQATRKHIYIAILEVIHQSSAKCIVNIIYMYLPFYSS